MLSRNSFHVRAILLVLTLGVALASGAASPPASGAASPPASVGNDTSDNLPSSATDTPHIVFAGNGVVNIPPLLLDRFFHCLCDFSTTDCFMFFFESNAASNNYEVTEVREVARSRDSEHAGSSSKSLNTPPSYTCQSTVCSLFGVLYCSAEHNTTYSVDEKSNAVARPPPGFLAFCDESRVILNWTSEVEYFNFGRGPVTVEDDHTMCLAFSDDAGNENCIDVSEATSDGNGEDNGNNKRDTNNDNIHQRGKGIKDKNKTAVSADNERGNNNGDKNNKPESDWYMETFLKYSKLVILFSGSSLAVNLIFLVLLIYLCIDKRKKSGRKLENLSPIIRPGQPDSSKQISVGEPFKDSLNTSYQDIDDDDLNAIKLRVRGEGDYLTPRDIPTILFKRDECDSSETNAASCNSSTTGRGAQEYEDVSLIDTTARQPYHVGQGDNPRSYNTYTNWIESPLSPKAKATQTDATDDNINQTSSPAPNVAKRKEIISALLKSTFNGRPRFFTVPMDGTDPTYVTEYAPANQTQKTEENSDNVVPTPRANVPSDPKKEAVARKKQVPRKPRRSREQARLTHDTSGYRHKSKTVAAPEDGDDERHTYENNLAFTSAESDENVMKFMRERTSTLYCNM
ncbi:hypothetical protein ElyMa_001672900 [Elysia marginata]|uniref:Uncharacterized protein n=1 Tax=Elysia marginata TaxID=1093978 RepID=A0AAV4JU16_9GAST|nr:hypothetical protein ElyMa_001672900 [Elysia marginata]